MNYKKIYLIKQESFNKKRAFIYLKVADEALSSFQLKSFLALKELAKSNGFKYVWHSCGQFLARWRDGRAVHVSSSVEDLIIILKVYHAPVDVSERP